MKNVIPYSRQNILNNDVKKVIKVLKSDFITRGPENENFENKIKKYVNSKYCLTTNSATSALYIACRSLKLSNKDIVWTSPISFAASANCAALCGAKIDFIDIDLDSYNISVSKLEEKLKIAKKNNRLPKILVVVHYAGYPCDMKEIYILKKKYKFYVIEDASHAIGSSYSNIKVGSNKHSDLTVFSFQAVKVITSAEGGSVTTNNKKIYDKLKILRSHGINKESKYFEKKKNSKYPWYYEQIDLSFNFILPDINAALGLSQLSRLNKDIIKRNNLVKFYKKMLSDSKIKILKIPKFIKSSHHLLPALFEFKDFEQKADFFNFMKKKNIILQVLYIPIYRHPFYKKRGYNKKNFKNSEYFYKNVFSLPLHLKLDKQKIKFICKNILKWINKSKN